MVTKNSREASSSIAGYLYQFYLTAEDWLRLSSDEVLTCEGHEDYDIEIGKTSIQTQVKHRRQAVSPAELRRALLNFLPTYVARHREGTIALLRYRTTSRPATRSRARELLTADS